MFDIIDLNLSKYIENHVSWTKKHLKNSHEILQVLCNSDGHLGFQLCASLSF